MRLTVFLTLILWPIVGASAPLVIAHRGASGYLPEHTLEAKAAAHAMGADYLEQDIVLSRDGVLMVMHDIHLDATTDVAERFPDRARVDGRFYAIDFTAAEIQSLNAGERRSLRDGNAVFKDRFPVGLGTFRVPTLAEEIALIQGLNQSTKRETGLYIEIKEPAFHRAEGADISVSLLDLLGKFDIGDQLFVQCFDWQETQRLRKELGYQGRLVQLLGENDWWDLAGTDFDWLRTAEGMAEIVTVADGIGPRIQHVLDEKGEPTDLVRLAHQVGLVVHPYTFRADRMPEFATDYVHLISLANAAGVDGMFTDFPDLTRSALTAQ